MAAKKARGPQDHDTRQTVMGVDPGARGKAVETPLNFKWTKVGMKSQNEGMVEPRHGFSRNHIGGIFTDASYNSHMAVFNPKFLEADEKMQQTRLGKTATPSTARAQALAYNQSKHPPTQELEVPKSNESVPPRSICPRPMTGAMPAQFQDGIPSVSSRAANSSAPANRPQTARPVTRGNNFLSEHLDMIQFC